MSLAAASARHAAGRAELRTRATAEVRMRSLSSFELKR